jgi:hypothetical protein
VPQNNSSESMAPFPRRQVRKKERKKGRKKERE